jgi:cell division septum initiation protein DivIVA
MSPGRPKDFSKKQRELRADTAKRLEAIVEAAERAAASVIDDAEGEARRYLTRAREDADRLADRQVGELAETVDSLVVQAISLRHEAERLQASLEAAKARIGGGENASAPAPAEPTLEELRQAPRLRAVDTAAPAPAPAPEPSAAQVDATRADPAGARLLAAQMAVSGSSREEIAQRLRNGFEIEDADAILDAILGPEA